MIVPEEMLLLMMKLMLMLMLMMPLQLFLLLLLLAAMQPPCTYELECIRLRQKLGMQRNTINNLEAE
eukprot:1804936-Pleurochrysis_carterae.AAC.1